MNDVREVAIVGAGPAGLTACLYASMYGLEAVCVGDEIGGKLTLAPEIIDYPGIEKISGKDYVEHLHFQIKTIQAQIVVDEITSIQYENSVEKGLRFSLHSKASNIFYAQSIILATGNGNKQKVNRGADFARSLGVRLDKGLLMTDQHGKTNVNGIFAAGDCVVYPSSLEQLATAISSAVIAMSGVYELKKHLRPPILWGEAKIGRV